MNRVGNHRSWLCYAGSLLVYSKEEEEEEEERVGGKRLKKCRIFFIYLFLFFPQLVDHATLIPLLISQPTGLPRALFHIIF